MNARKWFYPEASLEFEGVAFLSIAQTSWVYEKLREYIESDIDHITRSLSLRVVFCDDLFDRAIRCHNHITLLNGRIKKMDYFKRTAMKLEYFG